MTRHHAQRGLTLIELLVTLIVLGVFSTAALAYFKAHRQSTHESEGYARDVREMSRLMEALETDLRTGKRLNHFGWEQRGPAVYRGKRRIAQRIATFDVSREAHVARITIQPLQRRKGKDKARVPLLSKRIVLRTGGGA